MCKMLKMSKLSILVSAAMALASMPVVGYALAPARIVLEGAKAASEAAKIASEGAKVAQEGTKVVSEAAKAAKAAEPIASATQNTGRVMADQSAKAASVFTKGHEYTYRGYKIMHEVERGGWWVQRTDGKGVVSYFESVKDAEAYAEFMSKSLK